MNPLQHIDHSGGGAMMPLAFMPPWMRSISHVSPIKWGILAMEGGIWRGFTLPEMLLPCGVLLAFGSAFFCSIVAGA